MRKYGGLMTKTEHTLDLICLGRAAVDLYGEQIGSSLEDVSSFSKSLGGCAANIAVGAARQGLTTAMLTRVGDEQMGRFVQATLHAEGVDTRAVSVDPERLTGLVLLSIRDKEQFPLVFYRQDCADMALAAEHVDPAFIASARALVLTGTHMSTPGTRNASRAAALAAKQAQTRVVLDIDYRPVLWQLTGHAQGEDRYVASVEVTRVLQEFLPDCDLIVGTEEELCIAGGSEDLPEALRRVRELSAAPIVLKRGPEGCTVYEGPIADNLSGLEGEVFEVEVLNVLGAGDAFMAGFLRGWLLEDSFEAAARYGNACGALVVSRHACAPAIPTRLELDTYLGRSSPRGRIDLDPELDRLHWVQTRPSVPRELCILAFDHRSQLEALAESLGRPPEMIVALKSLIADGAARAASKSRLTMPALIVDAQYGQAVLDRLSEAGSPWWVARPIELSGDQGLGFVGDPNVELHLRAWPRSQVVKCLMHPVLSDAALTKWQQARVVRLARACRQMERSLLLEILPRATPGTAVDFELSVPVIQSLYDVGVQPDLWKLPAPQHDEGWQGLSRLIRANDPHCQGVLVLGLHAETEALKQSIERAGTHDLCRGFAVGRTIFFEPARAWLSGDLNDERLVAEVAEGFGELIVAFRKGRGE